MSLGRRQNAHISYIWLQAYSSEGHRLSCYDGNEGKQQIRVLNMRGAHLSQCVYQQRFKIYLSEHEPDANINIAIIATPLSRNASLKRITGRLVHTI